MPSVVLLPLLLVLTAVAADPDYCSISSCSQTSDHTMCLYTSSGAASACGTVVERGVSAAEQAEILTAHNTIRQDVKDGLYANNNLPAAQTMPSLAWDAELATVAQRWTDQCVGEHDKCRNVPSYAVGQNYAAKWTTSSGKNWTGDAVDQWFHSELPLFTQTNLTFVRGTLAAGAGHLTQVIWAGTTKIGCGFIAVEDTMEYKGTTYDVTRRNYFCNYGPAGNYINQEIYVPA